jgi:hypothetical protein
MWFSSQFKNWRCLAPGFRSHSPRRRRPDYGPPVEALECRTLLTAYAAATAADLIADINAANKSGGTNTITLTAPTTFPYVLSAVNNTTDGPTALPVIKKGDNLTIVTGNGSTSPGFGDTIDASGHFRLFDVASGASLTLKNVTLQNGYVFGSGAGADGGAIYNQGTLVLSQVLVQNNTAAGLPGLTIDSKTAPAPAGYDAAGGGIWSNGSLTLENATLIQSNLVVGGDSGYSSRLHEYGSGGNAFGGGIDIAGGTANITGTTFSFNTAQGGRTNGFGPVLGGSGYGGAVYVAGGTVKMSADIFGTSASFASQTTENIAEGGANTSGQFGTGNGGALYVAGGSVTLTNDYVISNLAEGDEFGPYTGGIVIASGATVSIDSFTVANTNNNYTYEIGANLYLLSQQQIVGTYMLL